eukprot:1140074-Pelagomonas_calceolata.AAC.3
MSAESTMEQASEFKRTSTPCHTQQSLEITPASEAEGLEVKRDACQYCLDWTGLVTGTFCFS